ncbi:MAG: hypothetical protein IT305_13245 [Chloroflexi bacterium]|nr:hypothetical protein [Chloroflexota bacterium]
MPSPSGRASRGASWLRLGVLLVLAALGQLLYVAIWPLSYYLTQAPDFTYEYLVQYQSIWQRLLPLLARFEAALPGASQSLDLLVRSLMQWFGIAFILYLAVFWLTRAGLPRGWGTVAVVAPPLAYQFTLFLMPGLFTTDLFSYVMYGTIAGPLAQNPFIALPSWFPDVRIYTWIHPIWHDAPSIYGPAWIDMSQVLAQRAALWTDVDKVLAYKLFVNVWHLIGLAALSFAVHRLRPGRVLEAYVLYAWNPLVLFEFGGNGHNDAVMVAIMLLAVGLFTVQARWLGLVTLTVSVLVKMSSILLLPYYVLAWAREQRSAGRFVGVGALAGATILVVTVAFYYPWWQGMDTIGPILRWSQGPMYLNYVPDLLAQQQAQDRIVESEGAIAPQVALDQARESIKSVARVVFAVVCLAELWWARGALGMAASGARVMAAFLLIYNTWVLPWYFSWPLALAVLGGWESVTARVLVGFSLAAPMVMYYRHFWDVYTPDWVYLLYLTPLAIAPVSWAFAALRSRFGMRVEPGRDPAPAEPLPATEAGRQEHVPTSAR